MATVVVPTFQGKSFSCIHCGTLTTQLWMQLAFFRANGYRHTHYWLCSCDHCNGSSLWTELNYSMIVPRDTTAPLSHNSLPDDCKIDFDEARNILGESPRGAAALLRLSLQKLCVHLGEKGKNINDDIAELVRKGLAQEVQQALDFIRISGNNAVHPGEINLEENPEQVVVMFDMINFIVEELIHRPQIRATRFASLPADSLAAIAKRDAPKP
ncbi:DUF4145 domain-containing protein [Pseudomonas sp. NPDC089734]|uniref:DUF4145 domain-containing protein n=1 Tax=Pseudomonas sp. NPDC089734 TaxID=3364469 RepID=UPI003823956B